MTTRAWLIGEFGSAAVFAVPTFVLTTAGARHVTHYGEPWALYVASVIWFWGPGVLLAVATLLQSRSPSPVGWRMSAVAAAAMSLLSAFVLWGFARQGDVRWSLWAMWISAALAAMFAVAAVVALAPSRRPAGGASAARTCRMRAGEQPDAADEVRGGRAARPSQLVSVSCGPDGGDDHDEVRKPIEPPVIIVGDGQVEMYRDARSVAVNVEAVDAHLYRGYDSKGRPIRIAGATTRTTSPLGLGVIQDGSVAVDLMSDEPTHAEELRAALLDWWARAGGPNYASLTQPAENWTLNELVAAVAERDGIR